MKEQVQTVEAELRKRLGRRVHQTWIESLKEPSSQIPGYLLSWDKLSEVDKEAAQQIGMIIWSDCLKENFHVIADVDTAVDQNAKFSTQDLSSVKTVCPSCGKSNWLITTAKIRKVCSDCGYWVPVSSAEAELSLKNWNSTAPFL